VPLPAARIPKDGPHRPGLIRSTRRFFLIIFVPLVIAKLFKNAVNQVQLFGVPGVDGFIL